MLLATLNDRGRDNWRPVRQKGGSEGAKGIVAGTRGGGSGQTFDQPARCTTNSAKV